VAAKKHNPLPGFGLTLGYTVLYWSVIVLIPLAGLFLKILDMSWDEFWRLASAERAVEAYKLTFGASLAAALVNAVFGTIVAWVLVRHEFPAKKFFDALVDFPFALPTAVAGLALSNLFAENGWLGQFLVPLGVRVAFTPLGIVLALTFVGLPFVVRTLQPVLADFEREVEEAAATLGSGRVRIFFTIIAPTLAPAILTGFALAFARAIGEYGSVIFIAGNRPFEEYNYSGAIVLAAVLLVISFVLLTIINALERWVSRFQH